MEAQQNPIPLDGDVLRARLVTSSGPYAALDVLESTTSTNSDLVARAARGAADRSVLLAEHQTNGRGRLHRPWSEVARHGMAMSVLLRPEVPTDELGWLPMLAGVALAETVRAYTGLQAMLKWPNDLLLSGRKAAGILVEGVPSSSWPPGVVLGIGANLLHRLDQLPTRPGSAPPTSLAAEGAAVDRTEFVAALLETLAVLDERWRLQGSAASGLLERYRGLCATLGTAVRVDLGDSQLYGTAVDIDHSGRLLVRNDDGHTVEVAVGDVVHVRPDANRGVSTNDGS